MKMTKKDKTEKSFEAKRAALLKGLASKDGVTEVAIKNVYGPHAMAVVGDFVDRKPERARKPAAKKAAAPKEEGKRARRPPRPPARYGAAATTVLPDEAEFRAALHKKYTTTARSLVEDAYGEIETLAGEAREAYDNMESGNLGQTQRCQTFGETADALENISAPDLPDAFDEVEIVRLPTISNATGRAHRLSEAVSDMQLACDEVESWLEDKKASGEDATDDAEEKDEDEEEFDADAVEAAIEEIRGHADEAEGVEFPGMYG
jgi:hypothetical protein